MKKFTLLMSLILFTWWQAMAQFTESFEGVGIPTGWTVINNGGTNTWDFGAPGNGTPRTGSQVAKIEYETPAHDDYLITPQFTVTDAVTDRITFYAKNYSSSPSYIDEFNVVISTTGNAAGDFSTVIAGPVGPPTTWTKYTYDLSTYEGQTVYIAIQVKTADKWELDVDDFSLDGMPTCVEPTTLTATGITSTSANLGWTESGSATTWNIEYGPTGFTQGTGTIINGTTTNPHNLTGLTANTAYQFYVQADCGGAGTSIWVGPFSFSTLCNAFSVFPFTETFEAASPSRACWTQIQETGTSSWTYATGSSGGVITTAQSGTLNARFVSMSGTNSPITKLVSPVLDLSGLTSPELTFYYGQEDWLGDQNTMKVYYKSSTMGPWTEIANYTTSVNAWTQVTLSLPNKSATYQIAFEGINNYGRANVVDNVVIQAAPACQAPTALNVLNTTSTSTNLTWTENGTATAWNIEYGPTGFTQGTGTMINGTTTNPHNLTGLTANTTYQFYVQADCGGAGTSTWAGPFSFYTGYCTPSSSGSTTYINNFSTSNGLTNISNLASGFTAGGYFDGSAQSVSDFATGTFDFNGVIVGGTAGFSIWVDWNNNMILDNATEKVFNTTGYANGPFTGTITIPGGTPNGNYRMRIAVDYNLSNPSNPCAAVTRGEFEDYTITVVAPPSCLPPSLLTAANITTSSADLGWTETGSATTWNIEYGITGFTQGTGTVVNGTTTNPHSISGLTSNTTYQFYVQADCGGSGTSTWAGPFSFTTACGTFSSFPFIETFEVASPSRACWTQIQETGTSSWTYATGSSGGAITTAHSGTLNARFVSMSGTNSPITKLVSPVLDLSSITTPELNFFYGQELWSPDQNSLKVYYRISPSDPWVEIFRDTTNIAAWTADTLSLPNPSATYQIAFEGINNYGRANVVDDVEIKDATVLQCSAPSNLIAGSITQTSAVLDWTENGTATEWDIEWGVQGFTQGTGTLVHVLSKPHLLTGLFPQTAYDFYVRATCGNGDSSVWVGPYTFMTPPCAPIGLELGNDTTLCLDESLTLTAPAGGPYAYTWSTTESTSSITVDTASLGGAGTYAVWVDMIDMITMCIYKDTIDVTFGICTGVNENPTLGFAIYPNPNNGIFTLQTKEVGIVEITNLQGKVVYRNNIAKSSEVIDLSTNSKGVYFVNMITEKGNLVQKIVVQ